MKLDIRGNTTEEIERSCKDWIKVQDVWTSCETPEQTVVAQRMVELYLRKEYKEYKLPRRIPIGLGILLLVLCGLVSVLFTLYH